MKIKIDSLLKEELSGYIDVENSYFRVTVGKIIPYRRKYDILIISIVVLIGLILSQLFEPFSYSNPITYSLIILLLMFLFRLTHWLKYRYNLGNPHVTTYKVKFDDKLNEMECHVDYDTELLAIGTVHCAANKPQKINQVYKLGNLTSPEGKEDEYDKISIQNIDFQKNLYVITETSLQPLLKVDWLTEERRIAYSYYNMDIFTLELRLLKRYPGLTLCLGCFIDDETILLFSPLDEMGDKWYTNYLENVENYHCNKIRPLISK